MATNNNIMDETEKDFYGFLSRNGVISILSGYSKKNFNKKDLFPIGYPIPILSSFSIVEDIFLYSELLVTLFKTFHQLQMTRIVDCGAGSCLPTIRAILMSGVSVIKVVAVENDSKAIQIGRANAEMYGCLSRYDFVQEDMISYLTRGNVHKGDVVVSNPPYLPIPFDVTNSSFYPVNGGPDGARYLEQILSYCYLPGTVLALRWSSLSNPRKINALIGQNYDVLHMEGCLVPFGYYAESPEVLHHIEQQHKAGVCVYSTDSDGKKWHVKVGGVLRKR